MKSIQIILIVLSLVTAVLGGTIFHSRLVNRLFTAILSGFAVILVLLPDLTTDLAQVLGVGRGTDLLFYIVFFAAVQVSLLLYLRTRRIERKLTESIRALALQGAKPVDLQPNALCHQGQLTESIRALSLQGAKPISLQPSIPDTKVQLSS